MLWFGLTYDFAKDKLNPRTNLEKSDDLLKYMVMGADSDKRKELLEFLVASRSTGTSEKPMWRDFKGNDEAFDPEAPTKGKKLPQPIDG